MENWLENNIQYTPICHILQHLSLKRSQPPLISGQKNIFIAHHCKYLWPIETPVSTEHLHELTNWNVYGGNTHFKCYFLWAAHSPKTNTPVRGAAIGSQCSPDNADKECCLRTQHVDTARWDNTTPSDWKNDASPHNRHPLTSWTQTIPIMPHREQA